MLNTILLAICAAGIVLINILLAIHMVHMKKAFDQVMSDVQMPLKKQDSRPIL